MQTRMKIFILAFIASVAGQSACPRNSALHGYTTINDINNAIAAIEGGDTPNPPYLFTLCPDTVFDSDQPLTPALSGAEFVCGRSGAVTDSCVIQGGDFQVVIQEPELAVPGYTLDNLTFAGITFAGATLLSIYANGADSTSPTTVLFRDCVWSDFSGNAAIQMISNAENVFTVAIDGGSVTDGTSISIFSNDNGALDITDLNITGFDGPNGITTTNVGATAITSTDVSGLGSTLQTILYVEGSGSTLNVKSTTIHDIVLAGSVWDGITYTQGATGVVDGIQFLQNSGVQFAINVDGGKANVTNSQFSGNTAAANTYTAIFYSRNNATLYLVDDNSVDNTDFYFLGFTGDQSFTSYDNTAFKGSQVVIAVFIDQNSDFKLSDPNFTNVVSQACPQRADRVFIEDVGSHCFYRQPGSCSGVCSVTRNFTFAPIVAAPVAPSKAPAAPKKPMKPSQRPAKSPPTTVPTTSYSTSPTTAVKQGKKEKKRPKSKSSMPPIEEYGNSGKTSGKSKATRPRKDDKKRPAKSPTTKTASVKATAAPKTSKSDLLRVEDYV